jgi:hypothetical protein
VAHASMGASTPSVVVAPLWRAVEKGGSCGRLHALSRLRRHHSREGPPGLQLFCELSLQANSEPEEQTSPQALAIELPDFRSTKLRPLFRHVQSIRSAGQAVASSLVRKSGSTTRALFIICGEA